MPVVPAMNSLRHGRGGCRRATAGKRSTQSCVPSFPVIPPMKTTPMNPILRLVVLIWFAAAATAVAPAAGLVNLVSFTEETKIKGGFVEVAGQLYFIAEKGGERGFGYLGRFDPASGTITAVHAFSTETKPKGLVRLGDTLYFQAEKGAATTGFGWLGRFDLATLTVSEALAFDSDLKPKSGLAVAGGVLYFATEKGGAANQGTVQKFAPDAGATWLADLTPELGVKIESWAVDPRTGAVFYGAREGGDLSQLGGKGGGALGRIDPGNGTVARLIAFHHETHGAKVRGLTLHAGRLWFVLEEGADLSLNEGKGGGALASYDLNSQTLTRHHVFDGATGFKPRGLVRVGDDFFVATEKGGAGGLGVLGVLRGGAAFEVLAEFDAAVGAKPDFALTVVGDRIYLTPELGTSGFLGGITAYELDSPDPLPAPRLTRAGKTLVLSWDPACADCIPQRANRLDAADWTDMPATAPGRVEVPPDGAAGFFRLRRSSN